MTLIQYIDQLWQELQTSITLNNSFVFSFLLLICFLFLCLKLTRGIKLNLPPSPPKFPIIGNVHQLGSLPHQSLRALSQKYGPLMLLKLGQTPTLVVSSSEILKEIVKSHDIEFSDRPKTAAADIFLYQCVDMAFSPYGEYWRQVRKICVLELLSHKRVHSFQFVRKEEVGFVVDKLMKASGEEASVNLSEIILTLQNNIVSRCVLGRKVEEENGESKFGELSRKALILFAAFSVRDVFPILAWIDILTGLVARQKATAKELDALLDQIIEEHLTEDTSQNVDFVHILLQLQKDGKLEIELTRDSIKGILMDMFVAGSDTTAAFLEWTMAELIRNPRVLRKAQLEVRMVVGEKSELDLNDVNRMEYLKCIMKESLRLHPPGALSVPRETAAAVKLGGYDIPSKTRVLINLWAIHRDPKLWDRHEDFVPERFHENPIDFKDQDFHFAPFGVGRRGCPGMSFSLASAEYILANLLCWFDWKLPGDAAAKDLDMSETFGLTVIKKFPLILVPMLHSS